MAGEVLSGGNIEPPRARGRDAHPRSSTYAIVGDRFAGPARPLRDGLKPVHRRVLFGMSELGLGPTRRGRSPRRIVGEVRASTTRTATRRSMTPSSRLAQGLLDAATRSSTAGQLGSVDDDPAAAMRTPKPGSIVSRWRCCATSTGHRRLRPNYDGQQQEPLVLPRRASPTCWSTAPRACRRYGDQHSATQPARVIDPTVAYVENPVAWSVDDLMAHVTGPRTSRTRRHHSSVARDPARPTSLPRPGARPRARAHTEPLSHGKEAIVVTELPYQVKKGRRQRSDGGRSRSSSRTKKITRSPICATSPTSAGCAW